MRKPVTPMHEERAEDDRVFGLGLDADAVRALHVAAHDRPADADQEHDAREVGADRVRLVRAGRAGTSATPGSWWSISLITVAMNSDDEAEVEARVHDAGGGVAQQRLHPDAACGSRRTRRSTFLRVVRRSSGWPRS